MLYVPYLREKRLNNDCKTNAQKDTTVTNAVICPLDTP